MLTLFHHFARFVNNMDARAITSMLVMLMLLGFVVIMLVYGTEWLGINQNAINDIMFRVEASPFALLGVIAVFSVLALTGFPQTLLIAGTATVFGAEIGALYSWIGTMCSATLTFALGHVSGGRFIRRLSAGRASMMISVVQHRGLLASMIVRVVPSAPFIVINAICGAANIAIWKFWVGTGVGIIPKILIVSIFTSEMETLIGRLQQLEPMDFIPIAALIVGWLFFLVLVRWIYMRLRGSSLKDLGSE